MKNTFEFHDEAALLERLSKGLKRRDQEVVFLVGAPLSAPLKDGEPGVPNVEGVIKLIREEFSDDVGQVAAFDQALQKSGNRCYQTAFQFLQGRRGQPTANEIVRKAVMMARKPGSKLSPDTNDSYTAMEEAFRLMDLDASGWYLNPGTKSIGVLATHYPDRFGKSILTTNFDPLIEVAIRRAGGNSFRTTLHADGNLSQTEGTGCHVIHLHGYWYGSDTLHTSRQLGQIRPRLRASLNALLRSKVVVVAAYGGWDDSFTEALMDVVRDDTASPEVLWTFYSHAPDINPSLAERLEVGLGRGRVTLYSGIDCHEFLPKVQSAWQTLEAAKPLPQPMASNPVRIPNATLDEITKQVSLEPIPAKQEENEDRPPFVEICVGRDRELYQLRHSDARIIFLTGFGGQGKSTLAAKYFAESQIDGRFTVFIWRDCKEESERFENQLASVISRLSKGQIKPRELSKHSAVALMEILTTFMSRDAVLFIFDNVDHYVNLETKTMVGSADTFIEALLRTPSQCKVLFTCRPSVKYEHPEAMSIRVEGLEMEAAAQLFEQRGASSKPSEIEAAHALTKGHAFWLDLLALQVVRRSVGLTTLVSEIESGAGLLPDKTLNSIWATLKDREHMVLRAMAETVKPNTEVEIADYLRHELNYAKVVRALASLRALNLIVVKRLPNTPDVLELHPLVRQFIRLRFTTRERVSFIDAIIKVYKRFTGVHKSQLDERPPLHVLEYWTQTAELDIAAGKYNDAFIEMAEVADAFRTSAYPREYVRTARLLLKQSNWTTEHAKFKGFESVFRAQIRNLSYLGEYGDADQLLTRYEVTVAERDARYINYCELRCFSYWVRGELVNSIEWGKKGESLKLISDVDTQYDIAHSLALAQRDAGQPELALPVFLRGRSLSAVIDPDELDEKQDGAYYGNIGRCLHFAGQIDGALVCYQKSALLIEKSPTTEHVLNQGYIRSWIGELLVGREQFKLASIFFKASHAKWQQVSPPKAEHILRVAGQIKNRIPAFEIKDREAEKICLDWIFGRTADSSFK
jgi:tetratricopeptide (TPR) repeat protein